MRESNGRVFDLQQGDLVVTDRANGLRKRLAFVLSKRADILVGISPSKVPMQEEQGKALAVKEWRVWATSLRWADLSSSRLDHVC